MTECRKSQVAQAFSSPWSPGGLCKIPTLLKNAQAESLCHPRKGFSLMELLFAIFIMGTALAMSAALFPTAMRENKSSIDNVVGAIICKNAFTLTRVTLQQRDITSDQVEIIADESDDHQDKLSLETQHYPYGMNDGQVRLGAKVRGFVLLGRMLNVSKPEEGYQLVAVAYARNRDENDPNNPNVKVTVETVNGEIINLANEETSRFKATGGDEQYFRMGSPLIFAEDGTAVNIVAVAGDEGILDTKLNDNPNVRGYVVIDNVDPHFSPAMATMATRTGLR